MTKFTAHVWGPGANKITRKRSFKTMWGAMRFAERESALPGIIEVSITDDTDPPHGRVGPRVAKFCKGKADVIRHTDNTRSTINQEDPTDMGKDTKPKAARKPAATKTVKAKNGLFSIKDILALDDRAIAAIAPDHRPELPENVTLPTAPYATVYARFLSGERKWFPNPWMSKTDADVGQVLRRKVRTAVGRAAGVPVGNVDGAVVRVAKSPAPAKTKPTPKPAAAKASTRKRATATKKMTAKRRPRRK